MDVLCEETDLNGCGSAASMYSLGVKFVGVGLTNLINTTIVNVLRCDFFKPLLLNS